MKKITISLVAVVAAMLLPVSSFAASATFDDGTTWNCDQYFAPEPVRYWTNYTFSDNFINYDTSRNVYLNTFQIQYKGAQYLSAGSDFAWTQAIRNANFTVSPGQTISTLTTGPNWAIVKHPTTRAT